MYALPKISDCLRAIQLGVGVSGGCEAAVHSARQFVMDMPTGSSLVKLDFSNAFNCLSRTKMVESVHSLIPEIYSFCSSAYSQPTFLKYGDKIIYSREGVQQGDPLGPLLFSLTIQPLLSELTSSFRISYLDDLTLGGQDAIVANDVKKVMEKGAELGLKLNISKCEIISQSLSHGDALLDSFAQRTASEAELLGASLTSGGAMDRKLEKHSADLERAAVRLQDIQRHDALILLRRSLSAPKVMHTLRTSPCSQHHQLLKLDKILKDPLCSLLNADLSETQWLQASLPVRRGGLGICSILQLALSAFLASYNAPGELQLQILGNYSASVDLNYVKAESVWSSGHQVSAPVGTAACLQRNWDEPIVDNSFSRLFDSQSDAKEKARLLAVSAPKSSDWLHALPIASCGLRLDDEAVRIAAGLRLGSKLGEPHECVCDSSVDPRGHHGLSCSRSSGRSSRHHNPNDIVWRALAKAEVAAVKEPNGLSRSDGKRPDGLIQIPWVRGKSLLWDVTVTDTLANSYIDISSVSAGGAAELAADRKLTKYSNLLADYCFIPLAFEMLGPLNKEGDEFLTTLGKRLSAITGDKRESCFLRQRLSICLQTYNSVCVKGTFNSSLDLLHS